MPIPNTFASQTGPIPLSELDANFAYLINETEVTLPAQIAGLSLTNFGKNMVINGDCSISQINGSTLTTPTTGAWPIDMVLCILTQASKLQTQQVFTSLNSLGATSALQWSVLSSYSPISTDRFSLSFTIEGYNFARCQFGTANAKPVSLQFKVNASVGGTYSGAINNYAGTRSYPFQFTVSAGVDTLIQIPNIAGDTGGSWFGATNAGAALVSFDIGCGTNFKSTAGTWQTGGYFGVTGSTNLVAQTNGSTLTITDVQLEQSANCTGFDRKYWSKNLEECQRYYSKTFTYATAPAQNTGNDTGAMVGVGSVTNVLFVATWKYPTTMRALPTILTYSPNAASANWSTNVTTPTAAQAQVGDSSASYYGTTAVTVGNGYFLHATADARI